MNKHLERGYEEIKLRNFKILISLITINRETFVYPLYEKKKQNLLQI